MAFGVRKLLIDMSRAEDLRIRNAWVSGSNALCGTISQITTGTYVPIVICTNSKRYLLVTEFRYRSRVAQHPANHVVNWLAHDDRSRPVALITRSYRP